MGDKPSSEFFRFAVSQPQDEVGEMIPLAVQQRMVRVAPEAVLFLEGGDTKRLEKIRNILFNFI